jgi:hypothetical protein
MFCQSMGIAMAFLVSLPSTSSADEFQSPASKLLDGLIGTWEAATNKNDLQETSTSMSFRWAAGKEVVVWEGTLVAEESNWSFVAVKFFDRVKERMRIFSFTQGGQRHLGMLESAKTENLIWKLSGIRSDGTKERLLVEFIPKGNNRLVLKLRDRRPAEEPIAGDVTIELRRVAEAAQPSSW